MIKCDVNMKTDDCEIIIKGSRHNISEELAQLLKALLEREVFESSDLACILALVCNETNQKRITIDSKQAMRNLLKKL